MERIVLYHLTFAPNRKSRLLHLQPQERTIGVVHAVEDNEAFRAYHLDAITGKHLVPDPSAIRAALPHCHRKAFDRAAGRWWYPLTLSSALSGIRDPKNACSLTLQDSRGRLLGTLYATPYLYSRGTEQG